MSAVVADSDTARPLVSVVVPTYDEADRIDRCLESLQRQDYPAIVEILVVDGRSRDATRELVTRWNGRDPRVRLLDNPDRSAAAALNIGLAEAVGGLFVRADAHADYAPDYVRRCVEVAAETGAANVGGPMRPRGTNRFGRAVAAVTSTRVAVGGHFHYATEREDDVDTVYLGCYRVEELRRLGGWDADHLQWAAEDHELNFRLRKAGGRIVCDPTIRSVYFPRESARALWRQYGNYGVGKVSTLVKHRALPSLRPLAPAALVAGTVAGVVMSGATRRVSPLVPVAAWAGLVVGTAARLARDDDVDPSSAAAAMAICHVAYGIGVWRGVARVVRGRGFDRLPLGAR